MSQAMTNYRSTIVASIKDYCELASLELCIMPIQRGLREETKQNRGREPGTASGDDVDESM
jgi:hypothetical protein